MGTLDRLHSCLQHSTPPRLCFPCLPARPGRPLPQPDKANQMLPIGGPGPALTAADQAELLFDITGRKPWVFPVPVVLMDGIIALLDSLASVFPGLKVRARLVGGAWGCGALVWAPQDVMMCAVTCQLA